eukprot:3522758-Pyramimonas_sp.AAC.1
MCTGETQGPIAGKRACHASRRCTNASQMGTGGTQSPRSLNLLHPMGTGGTQSPRSVNTGESEGREREGRSPGGRVGSQLAERGRHRGNGVQ